ncbi:dephospho-CoA kinase [Fusibacter bizertensis]
MKPTNERRVEKSPYLVGVTGGIGSGKSTVSQILISRGFIVIDADEISREVVAPGSTGLERLVAYFGGDILDDEGQLNRRKLGEYVFDNPQALEKLNHMLHPLIRLIINDKINAFKNENVLFIDVPLLFEAGFKNEYNEVLLIYVDEETALNRIISRDQITKELAIKKINAQMSIETKRKLADYVIVNDDSIAQLNNLVSDYLDKLMNERIIGK